MHVPAFEPPKTYYGIKGQVGMPSYSCVPCLIIRKAIRFIISKAIRCMPAFELFETYDTTEGQ